MNKEELPPVQLNSRRYATSIPSGKISQFSPAQIPAISRKDPLSRTGTNILSMHDLVDQTFVDQKLKSLSHTSQREIRMNLETQKREKANLKFLRYKFNPGNQELQGQNIERGQVQYYGQLGKQKRLRITLNVFYSYKNVIFQDERAPLVYKSLFLERQHQN